MKKNCKKSFGNFEKTLGLQEKTAKGTGKFVQQRQKFEISRFELPRVFCFNQVTMRENCPNMDFFLVRIFPYLD